MTDGNEAAGSFGARLKTEILRWNSIVNLMSRRDSATTLDSLVAQCETGGELVERTLADLDVSAGRLQYVDLGSGNGLPGLLWAASFRARGLAGGIWLFEPRARRAWFLSRAARQLGLADVTVVRARWGECIPALSPDGDILVSLKALKLTEPEVLAGLPVRLTAAEDPDGRHPRAIIARFVGPDAGAARELERDLLLASDLVAATGWQCDFCQIVEGARARMLITAYHR